MKFIIFLFAMCFLSTPTFAQNVANHSIKLTLDPAHGKVHVDDHIQMTGGGKMTFQISRNFRIKKLVVNDRPHSPIRTDGGILVDLGDFGQHQINIITQATFPTTKAFSQPPYLNAEGGFLWQGWIASPEKQLTTWDIEGISPASQKWLTTGKLVFEDQQGGKYMARFQSRNPSTPPLLITGPYQISERKADGVRIRTYFHKELAPLADGYLTDTAKYIKQGSQTIGGFPYGEFSIVSAPLPVGFGLPGIAYMGRKVLALPFIRTTSLPHEVLHNWWGNAVDVDYASGNWAEGLTSYQADMAQSAIKNNDGGRSKRLEWLRNFAALAKGQDSSLQSFTSRTHDASQIVGYGKAAFVFHMLKTTLGDKAFNAGLQNLYKKFQFKAASWADIQSLFEATSKQDLSAFFTSWISRPGAPKLKLQEARSKSGQLSFRLTQIQQGPGYPLTIPILVKTKDGQQMTTINMVNKDQTFQISTKGRAIEFNIDPNVDVFRQLSPDEAPPIFRDITLNKKTILVTPGGNKAFNAQAQQLAALLLQRPVSVQKTPLKNGPQIIIGLESDVPAAFTTNLPSQLRTPADGRVFTVRKNGQNNLIVTVKNLPTLLSMMRSLPHYKRRSYVIFKAGKAIQKGEWPASNLNLSRKF